MSNVMDKINPLLQRIGRELGEDYQYLFIDAIDFVDNNEKNNTLKQVSIINNKNNDYFIFLPIELNKIESIIDEYQIYLDTYIVKAVKKKNKDFIISNSFNKNRSLILITQGRTTRENRQKVAEVEEDPYFFKKQVLLLNKNEMEEILMLLKSESIIQKCHDIISDNRQFTEFKKELSKDKVDKSAHYSLVTKLYEKLPFLTLNVTNKKSKNLKEHIDSKLVKTELLTLKNKLMSLKTEEDINNYIDALIYENNELLEKKND